MGTTSKENTDVIKVILNCCINLSSYLIGTPPAIGTPSASEDSKINIVCLNDELKYQQEMLNNITDILRVMEDNIIS